MTNTNKQEGADPQEDDALKNETLKLDRRARRDHEAAAKEKADQGPGGLRSQGEVKVVDAKMPDGPAKVQGRRTPPTRHDAMEIAGHERLPGYKSVPGAPARATVDAAAIDPAPAPARADEVASATAAKPVAVEVADLPKADVAKPAADPAAVEAGLEATRELTHSAEDAVADDEEDKDAAKADTEDDGEEEDAGARKRDRELDSEDAAW